MLPPQTATTNNSLQMTMMEEQRGKPLSMEEEEELGQYLRVKIQQCLVGLALGLNEVYLFSPKYTIV